MLIPMLCSIFYLLTCFIVASAAKNKNVGSQRTFHIAVLLTPLVAFIVVVLSSKKTIHELKFLPCRCCGFEYNEKDTTCPACTKEGVNIFVNESIKQVVSLK